MLKDEIKAVIGNRRRFLLLRIAGIDVDTARKLCNIPKGTYNSWLKDSIFVGLYRRRDEFSAEYNQEAIQLLRRGNQLSAVLMEEKIICKMKEEIETGDYNIIRTNLARAVYDKLISDLDYQPQALALSWEQRLHQIFTNQPQIEGGQDAPVIEATGEFQEEHQESHLITEGQQGTPEGEEEVQD